MKSCEGNAVSVVTARSIWLESWRTEGRRVYSLAGDVKVKDTDYGIRETKRQRERKRKKK
jgi:hypothetical protein